MLRDRTRGAVGMALLTVSYVYYTCWVLVTPFIDRDHPAQTYFPPRWLGCLLPTAFGVLALGVAGVTLSLLLLHGGPPGTPARPPTDSPGAGPKDGLFDSTSPSAASKGRNPYRLHVDRLVPRHQRTLTW